MSLTEKNKRFADEWLIDMNGTAAAIRAGYSPNSADVTASRLLANAKIRAYLDERMAEHSRRIGVNQERIIRSLASPSWTRHSSSTWIVLNFSTTPTRTIAPQSPALR